MGSAPPHSVCAIEVTTGVVSPGSEIKQYQDWNAASAETVHRNSTQQFLRDGGKLGAP